MNPLTPDPKAGATLPEGQGLDCGCCDGPQAATPRQIHNRAGLPAVAYRIGEQADFQRSLIAGLSQGRSAPLTGLLTRDRSDFTIGLTDAFACAADVLTFYQERIANESWLRTATERVSLQEQARLIGHRLQPGVAAETLLAFAVEVPPTPPAGLAPEPGAFVTGVPDEVPLPAGLRVSSVPDGDALPQAFETTEALTARWPWNAMPAMTDEDQPPGFGARSTWLAGTATRLAPGDLLLFVGPEFDADPTSDHWDRRVVHSVEVDHAHNRTLVHWQEPLGSVTPLVRPANPPTVMALRERAAIFGHNAPDWSSMSTEFKLAYLGLSDPKELTAAQKREWQDFDIYAPGGSGTVIESFTTAQDAAAVLQTSVRAGAQQQARSAATATAQVLGGGLQLVQQIAQVPAETGGGLLRVLQHLPGVFDEVLAPLRTVADHSGQALTAANGAITQLQTTLGQLTAALGGGAISDDDT